MKAATRIIMPSPLRRGIWYIISDRTYSGLNLNARAPFGIFNFGNGREVVIRRIFMGLHSGKTTAEKLAVKMALHFTE